MWRTVTVVDFLFPIDVIDDDFVHQENESRRQQEKRRKQQEEERKHKGDTTKISESNTVIPP